MNTSAPESGRTNPDDQKTSEATDPNDTGTSTPEGNPDDGNDAENEPQGGDNQDDAPEKGSLLKLAAENLWRKFSGRKTRREIEGTTAEWGEDTGEATMAAAGKVAEISASLFASIAGIKAFYDVPAYFWQKGATWKEQARILESLKNAENGEQPSPIEAKLTAIKEAIGKSEFLTKKEGEELLKEIEGKIRGSEDRLDELKKQRNAEITALLEETIQTRIKGQEVLKQTMNTALMMTGLSMVRGTAYGAIALYQRDKQLRTEMAEKGEQMESSERLRRIMFDGFKEAGKKIYTGGGAETAWGRTVVRGVGVMEAITPVLRLAGFTDLMINEVLEETTFGDLIKTNDLLKTPAAAGAENGLNVDKSGVHITTGEGESKETRTIRIAFNKLMEQYDESRGNFGVLNVAAQNTVESVGATAEATGRLMETGVDAIGGTFNAFFPEAQAGQGTPEGMPINVPDATEAAQNASGPEINPDVPTADVPPPLPSVEAGAPAPEFSTIDTATRNLATVKEGDALWSLFNRQLVENPTEFGFTGDVSNEAAVNEWASNESVKIMVENNFVGQGQELVLNDGAAEKLSVVLTKGADGTISTLWYNEGTPVTNLAELETTGMISVPTLENTGTANDLVPRISADAADTAPTGTTVDTATTPDVAANPDTGSDYEPFEGQKELAATKKGDGIVRMMTRQLRANPEKFGFTGNADNPAEVSNWANKLATETAVEQEIIRASGDTRLATEAIGNLEVMVEPGDNGAIEIHFRAGGQDMNAEAFRNSEFAYDSETGPSTAALEGARGSGSGSTAGLEMFKGSPDVPNEFFEGNMVLVENENGIIVDIQWGDKVPDNLTELYQDMYGTSAYANYRVALQEKGNGIDIAAIDRSYMASAARLHYLTEGLRQLEESGQLDTGEANALRIMIGRELMSGYDHMNPQNESVQYAVEQAKLIGWTEPVDAAEVTPAPTAAAARVPTEAGASPDTLSNESEYLTRRGDKTIFKSKDGVGNVVGRLTFQDRDGDGTLEVSMPARSSDSTIKSAREALTQYGVTHEQLREFDIGDQWTDGDTGYRPTDFDHRVFEREVVRLERMKELAALMETRGLGDSDEFAAVQARIEADQARLDGQMANVQEMMKQRGIIKEDE